MSNLSMRELIISNRIYLLFTAILSVPVWMATEFYVKTIGVHEEEAVATALTMFFFVGVFTGRYLARLWLLSRKTPSTLALVMLATVIMANLAWIFFHTDFPLKGRAALNLLFYWIPLLIVSLGLGMLVKFVRESGQRQLREARTVAAQSQGELQLLQSQLSPHFLFNTLNNLYGLSITQHEKIPPLLLRLSGLLRYSVYEAREIFVPLKKEIEYINNYIEFEKIRLGQRLVFTADIQMPDSDDIKIAPMMLIVFIENAFKHSRNSAEKNVYIDIRLGVIGNIVNLMISNSFQTGNSGGISEHSGIGLANVYKRLELLYPKEHMIHIEQGRDRYEVSLQVKVKK